MHLCDKSLLNDVMHSCDKSALVIELRNFVFGSILHLFYVNLITFLNSVDAVPLALSVIKLEMYGTPSLNCSHNETTALTMLDKNVSPVMPLSLLLSSQII